MPQIPKCFYKNYVTGWFTTKITIFDPPCEEVFKFPTRYAQVFYTVDGCLRDASHNRELSTLKLRQKIISLTEHQAIKCCSQRPFQFPNLCPDIGDGYGCIPSTEHVSLGNLAPLDKPVPFSNELTSDGGIASNDFMGQDANTIFLSDTNMESVGLVSPVAKRSIRAKAYRSERKRHLLENEAVES